MEFVNIQNYDGEKGYLPNDRFPFTVTELGRIKYLVNFDRVENPSGAAYKIIREREETATATTVRNGKLLEALETKYYADLEAILRRIKSFGFYLLARILN